MSFEAETYLLMTLKDFAIAFKAAAAADPDAKLYYNDYNLETSSSKAAGAVRIVKLVQAAGARIDGVGLQAHLIVGQTPSRAALTSRLTQFTDLGVDVAYTELDVRVSKVPSSSSDLQQQGKDYVSVVGSCLDVPRCVGVTVWGFGDSHSWVPGTFSGAGEACLYDKNVNPKPAYTSISALLASASGKRTATAAPTVAPRMTLNRVVRAEPTGGPA
jgi:endo-1,4-beta-xylanase